VLYERSKGHIKTYYLPTRIRLMSVSLYKMLVVLCLALFSGSVFAQSNADHNGRVPIQAVFWLEWEGSNTIPRAM